MQKLSVGLSLTNCPPHARSHFVATSHTILQCFARTGVAHKRREQIPIRMNLRSPLCTVFFVEHTLSHTQSSAELFCHINSHHTRLSLTLTK